jgi:HK97 family phage major capsid protein
VADDVTDQATPPAGPRLTHSQAVNRAAELQAEIERIGELDSPTPEDEADFDDLVREHAETVEWVRTLERQHKLATVRAAGETVRTSPRRLTPPRAVAQSGVSDWMDKDPILEPDSIEDCRFRDPWDLRDVRMFDRTPTQVNAELRARALSAIGKMQGATDRVREAATNIVEQYGDSQGKLARLALALSNPAYLRGFSKAAIAGGEASANLDETEQRAVARVRDEARAMSLTDTAGGFLVPFQLDPTVILTANGSVNQIRQLARSVVATGDVWNGVSAGAVSWSYDAEAAQVSDDAPSFVQPSIPVYKAQGFVPISMEAMQDEANVTTEVGRLLAFGKDVLEANAFAVGSGSGQPTGIVTALVASSPTVIVTSTTTDTFALADIYKVQGALPARYRNMPTTGWLGNTLTYNRVRQFDTAGGAGLWAYVGDGTPQQLMNKTVLESEDMDGVIDASAENYVLVFGDFSNYVIADRIGMTVEFVPHLFGANNRPTNQRGWLAYVRHGADSVNDGAFRLLNVT